MRRIEENWQLVGATDICKETVRDILGRNQIMGDSEAQIQEFTFIYLVILFLAAPGLHCCTRAFSSCSEQGLLSNYGARASHYSSFSHCKAQAPGKWTSVAVGQGLNSCGSWALEHSDFSSCGMQAQ